VKKIAKKQINKLAPGLSVAEAANADALGGKPPSAYASAASEAYREVGARGQPQFQNGWQNSGGGPAPRYRPSQFLSMPTNRPRLPHTGGGGNGLAVHTDGDVVPVCADGMPAPSCNLGIDGLTFRVP
jgi:hypothetical protein